MAQGLRVTKIKIDSMSVAGILRFTLDREATETQSTKAGDQTVFLQHDTGGGRHMAYTYGLQA